jgi:hypothetical protein
MSSPTRRGLSSSRTRTWSTKLILCIRIAMLRVNALKALDAARSSAFELAVTGVGWGVSLYLPPSKDPTPVMNARTIVCVVDIVKIVVVPAVAIILIPGARISVRP